MSLPKIFDFTNYDQYPSDPNPTTDADIQDYLKNQNTLLTALTKRLWQPQTAYKVGDIVASPDMADGLVAQCVIAGTTSDAEPQWSVSEAQVTDNTCTWIMRPAYCYGLATNTDVENAYNNNSVEATRLLSLGIFSKLMNCVEKKIKLLAYPVGSIYMSMNSTNPETLFGGKWEAIAQGRCLIGAGTGTDSRKESKTFAAGDTGGEYNHQLTVGELAAHKHESAESGGQHSHNYDKPISGSLMELYRGTDANRTHERFSAVATSGSGAHSHSISMSEVGNNTPHNNMQPYTSCYIWRRTE